MTATAEDLTPGLVPDITAENETETEAAASAGRRTERIATSADLYRRWEKQQWAVADVKPGRDAAQWATLTDYSRGQMLGALAELEVGEVTVTHTLGSLIDAPPTEDDRIFLCTQLADEARHVKFFQTYLEDACGIAMDQAEGDALSSAADYAQVFAPELTKVTSEVRRTGDLVSWYRAVIYYHLITEGMLAATALRTTRFLARRLGLAALEEGLTNVTRDESRHVSFGLRAAQVGVAQGMREVVEQAHFDSLGMAAWVLIGPARHNPAPVIPAARISRAAQLQGSVDIAEERLVKQLNLIGLPDLVAPATERWHAEIDKALDAYQERWSAPHPIRSVARPASA